MILNSNKFQSPVGIQDYYPEVDSHAYLTCIVIIRCGLNSDPYYYLPFVVHASQKQVQDYEQWSLIEFL